MDLSSELYACRGVASTAHGNDCDNGRGYLMDLFDGFKKSKVLFAAIKLGIFDALHECSPQDAATLSQTLHCEAGALLRLLNALVSIRLLEKRGEGFALNDLSHRYLLSNGVESCVGYAMHSDQLVYPLWGDLVGAVIEGSNRWGSVFHSSSQEAFKNYYGKHEDILRFMRGMHSMGVHTSPAVARAVPLPLSSTDTHNSHVLTFLDVGGATGHLAHSVKCKYPNASCSVFELPAVVELVEACREEYFQMPQMSATTVPTDNTISFIGGDFLDTDTALPPACVYGLARILHDWDDDVCETILRRLRSSVCASGGVLIVDVLLPNEPAAAEPRKLLQSLNMLVQTHGKERSVSDVEALVRKAGFEGSMLFHITGHAMDAVFVYANPC